MSKNCVAIGAVALQLIFTICLAGCTSDDAETTSGENLSGSELALHEFSFGADGLASVNFELETSMTSIQLVSSASSAELRVRNLQGPSGEILFNSTDSRDSSLSLAGVFQPSPVTLNYPILDRTGTALPAGVYTLALQLGSGTEGRGQLTVLGKLDSDLGSGTVPIKVVFVGSIASDDKMQKGTRDAIDICAEIADNAGLNLSIDEFFASDRPSVLPNPRVGNPLFLELSKSFGNGIPLYMAVDVEGLRAPENEFGIAGGIPGALTQSTRTGIAISLIDAAGPDGEFDSGDLDADNLAHYEVRVLGETICHELFQYLGLLDSVTFQGSTVVSSDALDTPKCSSIEACEENEDANSNIMFPYPLDEPDSDPFDYFARDDVSNEQRLVLQRAVGVN